MSRGMGKKELMSKTAKRSGMSVKDATRFYNAFVFTIVEAVCDCDGVLLFEEGVGPKILLAGLGSLQLRAHKGHPVGFTTTPDAFINEYPVLKFDVSPELLRRIRKMPKFKKVPLKDSTVNAMVL